ncbi:HTH domain-containing protein [Niallia sp. NCCP-28]|uniref:HTH domain-containing protein n=1 Tax=Niallia sp. NCCP-28 TaxID=2934712 RepID=UPI002082DFBE|nr:HTH domain-containing protein [Niallia sp. NCCP-28]GKU85304.1 hypothetical protein NCCP28_47000 [Niallia sp. NCCP-28]
MEEFINDLNIELLSENNRHEYMQAKIKEAIKNFQLKEEQIPKLLGTSAEKTAKLLQGEPCELTEEEMAVIDYRLIFISEGFSLMKAKERIRLLIGSFLIKEYQFSYKSLAAYAEVPYEAFVNFYNGDQEVDDQYTINICVNLQMLVYVLKNNER